MDDTASRAICQELESFASLLGLLGERRQAGVLAALRDGIRSRARDEAADFGSLAGDSPLDERRTLPRNGHVRSGL